jgi:hypothetical protein
MFEVEAGVANGAVEAESGARQPTVPGLFATLGQLPEPGAV